MMTPKNLKNSVDIPTIELISLTNDTLVFRSRTHFRTDDRVRVKVNERSVKVKVRETPAEVEDDDLYFGEVVEGREELALHFGDDSPRYTPKRRLRRVLHKMRVMSSQLPGFQALSLDFSPLGMKVQLDAPVEVNRVVQLQVDFDWPGQEPLKAQARVAWCQEDFGKHFAGLELLNLDELNRSFLEAFYREIVSGEVGEVAKAVSQYEQAVALSRTGERQVRREPEQITMEVSGHLHSYSLEGDQLTLSLHDGMSEIAWRFADLKLLRDHRGVAGLEVEAARVLLDSPDLQAVKSRRPVSLDAPLKPLRHIQLVNGSKECVLELIAVPMQFPFAKGSWPEPD